ncbi:hypothetical protein [Aquibacillus rhizosphaerae]|uniref:Uncharacterized protein n=1 Tax=Aquibacillus rhizosphaerae TaxID=3051431 RepID=A0ABT7KZN8_9BACI|nr:hypothetical protein [Aquibacillus sp. LR5S19]MDL4838933.1 hypothetical protein [Aquibacillus sp. LR5S19]
MLKSLAFMIQFFFIFLIGFITFTIFLVFVAPLLSMTGFLLILAGLLIGFIVEAIIKSK